MNKSEELAKLLSVFEYRYNIKLEYIHNCDIKDSFNNPFPKYKNFSDEGYLKKDLIELCSGKWSERPKLSFKNVKVTEVIKIFPDFTKPNNFVKLLFMKINYNEYNNIFEFMADNFCEIENTTEFINSLCEQIPLEKPNFKVHLCQQIQQIKWEY